MSRLTPVAGSAVVTGAAGGIGRAIASALAGLGIPVAGVDAAWQPADTFLVDMRAAGAPGSLALTADVADPGALTSALETAARELGPIGTLVNNAGITRDRVVWRMSPEDWTRVLDVNLTAAFTAIHAVAGSMRERGTGRIVQVASINGLRGKVGQANYAASKAGLIGLTKSVALELAPRGITCNAVTPGFVDTPMTAAMAPDARERAVASVPLGRALRATEVASAVQFLCSQEASGITGAVLCVDGGQFTG